MKSSMLPEVGKEILYLNREDCLKITLTNKEIIQFVEEALRFHGKKELEMPAKIGIHPLENTFIHAMPAYIPKEHACGIKWAAGFPENRRKYGLPQISALLILSDDQTGFPIAMMDATWITTVRTAAVTAIGIKYFGNLNSETFGMIGCGELGKKHIEFAAEVLPQLKKVYVYDIHEEAMDRLIKEVQPKIKAEIKKVSSIEEVVKNSLIVSSATIITSEPQPQIKDEWITKGQTLLLCDLHTLYEDKTMKRGDKYFVDSLEQNDLFNEYGYYPNGLPNIEGELGEVVAGLKKGREHENELVINNNIGMAVEDIIMGKAIYDKALEIGLGQKLKM